MREISVKCISEAVEKLCIKANKILPSDLAENIGKCKSCERNNLAKDILSDLEANLDAAIELDIPICQDTGMAVVFLEIGQDVHFTDGNLYDAVNEGVHNGYINGFLRCSVVGDPLRRVNTKDNTPAVIHTTIVDGENVKITVAPKGFGSENMSKLKMFTPASGREDIINYVLDCVKVAGGNPCPPIVLGIGIGGDFEQCAYLAKKALCRSVSVKNSDEFYREMEAEILERVNKLDIGPQGFGGDTTALSVAIETAPTHIAGLPVAVNFGCHVTRHATQII
ncbi:MAG: fumarate hydratase [Acutalibacteraceae bacterium]|nr:fumarate hydratase [Acutalibacteraceae bacterium]